MKQSIGSNFRPSLDITEEDYEDDLTIDPSELISLLDQLKRMLGSDPGVYTGLSPWLERTDNYHEQQRQWALEIISNNARYVCDTAKHYNMPPEANAGAILWEALENPYNHLRGQGILIGTRPGGRNDFGIPGKIHTKRDSVVFDVLDQVRARRSDVYIPYYNKKRAHSQASLCGRQ